MLTKNAIVILFSILLISIMPSCKKSSSDDDPPTNTVIQTPEDSAVDKSETAITPTEATTITANIKDVGDVSVEIPANTLLGQVTITIEKEDSIADQYTDYSIEEAGPAIGISSSDTTIGLDGAISVTMPFTIAISLADIAHSKDNLAVLRITGDNKKIIYPVEVVSDGNLKFSTLEFGTFQPIFIAAAEAEIAANSVTFRNLASYASLNSYFESVFFNGKLYFKFATPDYGGELWSYDGVNAPSITTDINPRSQEGSVPEFLTIFDNRIFFRADDGTAGLELWSFDGTSANLVTDLVSGEAGSYPMTFFLFQDKFYFASSSLSSFYSYNGSDNPTPLSWTSIESVYAISYPVLFKDKIFFNNFAAASNPLYSWSGENAKAEPKAITEYSLDSNQKIAYLNVLDDKLIIAVHNTSDYSFKIDSYDGSTFTTVAENIFPTATHSDWYILKTFVLAGKLHYVFSTSGDSKFYIVAFDGVSNTTTLSADVRSSSYAEINGFLYWTTYNTTDKTYELSRYQVGSEPIKIASIPDEAKDSSYFHFTSFRNRIFMISSVAGVTKSTGSSIIWEIVP